MRLSFGRVCVLSLLLFLALAGAARAADSVAAIEYGEWSAWQEEPIAGGAGMEVESEIRPHMVDHFLWHYSRYVYYNTDQEAWFASSREQLGDYALAGSGRWETTDEEQALKVTGKDGEDDVYEGGWFNEEVANHPVAVDALMYRSRTVTKLTCEVSSEQMLLFPEEQKQLTVNFFDNGSVSYESEDPEIAVVDKKGMVRGIKFGTARVTARSSEGRQVTIEVFVCNKQARIRDGVYTIRLVGSNRALTLGSVGKEFANLRTQPYEGEANQRFSLVTTRSKVVFKLHPLKHKTWSVCTTRVNKKISSGNAVRIFKRRDKITQRWGAVAVPDGSVIIYPKLRRRLALSARSEGAGNELGVRSVPDMDEATRWVLVSAAVSQSQEKWYLPPVVRDGVSYVTAFYGEEHPGIDFASSGRRAYVLAAARGTVEEVGVDCIHDWAKEPDGDGNLVDPCGSAGSRGNYVIIDHGNGMKTLYAHMSAVFVSVGDTVRQSSLLGRTGATGAAKEIGLYFEMDKDGAPVDPAQYIDLPKEGEPIETGK